jgi:hypothetical protein
MNFGYIKDYYVLNYINSKIENKKNDEFSFFLKTLKENKDLNQYFKYLSNIDRLVEIEDKFEKSLILNEVLESINKLDKNRIKEGVLKLSKDINFEYVDNDKNIVYENLEKIIFNKKIDLFESVNLKKEIVESFLYKEIKIDNDIPVITESNELDNLINLCVEKYNERYKEIDNESVKVLKSLLENNYNEKLVIHSSLKEKSINKIDKLLKESEDSELKVKLLESKIKIIEMSFSEKNINNTIKEMFYFNNELEENE